MLLVILLLGIFDLGIFEDLKQSNFKKLLRSVATMVAPREHGPNAEDVPTLLHSSTINGMWWTASASFYGTKHPTPIPFSGHWYKLISLKYAIIIWPICHDEPLLSLGWQPNDFRILGNVWLTNLCLPQPIKRTQIFHQYNDQRRLLLRSTFPVTL